MAGLLSLRGNASWQNAIDGAQLDRGDILRRHAYTRVTGPLLARYQGELQTGGEQALWLWEAIGEACEWLCDILLAAFRKELLQYDGVTGKWTGFERLIASEEPLSFEFREDGWRFPVRITGIPDLVLYDAEASRWCCVEFKLGSSAPESDLAQAALYCRLLERHAGIGGTLALVRFNPKRQELLLDSAKLRDAQAYLLRLAGNLAQADRLDMAPKPVPAEYEDMGKQLIATLSNFGLDATLLPPTVVGPSFARYAIRPGRTTQVKRVVSRAEDLGVQLGVDTPMIQTDDGRVVIDIPRKDREVVPFSAIRSKLAAPDPHHPASRLPVGVDLSGRIHWLDFSEPELAHVLVAGTAGSGKSEWLRTAIASLLLSNTPDTLRLVLVDPKRTAFAQLRHSPFLWTLAALLLPPEHSFADVLNQLVEQMECRYQLFERAGVDHLSAYCEKTKILLPRIFCICDEFADVTADRREQKIVEDRVVRLGAKARAAGIHLILATQHPDARTITGRLQANVSARVCLRASTYQQSLVALKATGAERLLGRGDLLFSHNGRIVRLQAPYLSDEERAEIFSGQPAGQPSPAATQ
jgi:hypothetical protein